MYESKYLKTLDPLMSQLGLRSPFSHLRRNERERERERMRVNERERERMRENESE